MGERELLCKQRAGFLKSFGESRDQGGNWLIVHAESPANAAI